VTKQAFWGHFAYFKRYMVVPLEMPKKSIFGGSLYLLVLVLYLLICFFYLIFLYKLDHANKILSGLHDCRSLRARIWATEYNDHAIIFVPYLYVWQNILIGIQMKFQQTTF